MERRLTKRVGCGEAVPVEDNNICAPFVKAGRCKTGCESLFSKWERHCNDECQLGMLIDKLAAYEDCFPLGRVQELAEAEQDGRLVVLPCKIGSTVFAIEECECDDEDACDCVNGLYVGEVYVDEIQYRKTEIDIGQYEEEVKVCDWCNDFYLTREEAEAATQQGGDGDG